MYTKSPIHAYIYSIMYSHLNSTAYLYKYMQNLSLKCWNKFVNTKYVDDLQCIMEF